jgi:hypothetical protein
MNSSITIKTVVLTSFVAWSVSNVLEPLSGADMKPSLSKGNMLLISKNVEGDSKFKSLKKSQKNTVVKCKSVFENRMPFEKDFKDCEKSVNLIRASFSY